MILNRLIAAAPEIAVAASGGSVGSNSSAVDQILVQYRDQRRQKDRGAGAASPAMQLAAAIRLESGQMQEGAACGDEGGDEELGLLPLSRHGAAVQLSMVESSLPTSFVISMCVVCLGYKLRDAVRPISRQFTARRGFK